MSAAADQAALAGDDAARTADLAEDTEQATRDAVAVLHDAASLAERLTASKVEAAADRTAKTALQAAQAVRDEAVARALEVAGRALAALERLAAGLPPGTDPEAARIAARVMAASVAIERDAQARATELAADTVAKAVHSAADQIAASAVAAAVTAARDRVAMAVDLDDHLIDLAEDTAVAARQAAASTSEAASLTARLRVLEALQDSEELFAETFERAPIGMLLVSLAPDDAGSVLRANTALATLTGRAAQDLVGMQAQSLFPVDTLPTDTLARPPGGNGTGVTEARWTVPGSGERWVEVTGHRHTTRAGRRPFALYQVQDVTRRRRTEEVVRRRRTRLRVAFEQAGTGMVFVDLAGQVGRANPAMARFLGLPQEQLLGESLVMFLAEADRPALRAAIAGLVAGDVDSYQGEHCFSRPGATPTWGLLTGSLVTDADGRADYLVFQAQNVTDRLDAENRLAHQALHDDLTGLPNRILLYDHLEQARARSRRDGSKLAVLFLDLDDFKDVNDSLGHAAGDEVLVEVAARVTSCLRESDTAARLGGDEFVLVCSDLADPADSALVAARLDAALATPFFVAGTALRVSASIGIAVDDGTLAGPDLLRNADTAMYRAKAHGKDRHEVFVPAMLARAVRHLSVASELQVAVEQDQLRLHYQAIYEPRTRRLVGVEALLRWEHPSRGLLHPADFLDVAERRRLMVPIGNWVLCAALPQAARWVASYGERAPRVWINVSGEQLGDGLLPQAASALLSTAGVSADKIGLEITERQLIGRGESVRDDLLALRELGVRLAVDDFGTGFASLEYLRRFPLDEIKIDQSFVGGLGTDRTDTAITTSIVALGRSLDLDVVAEGVETQGQYDRLLDLGCDLVQGYLLQRPADAGAIDLLLDAGVDGNVCGPAHGKSR